MVERCRPLLQQIAKHGDCFEHVQSNRIHNTDLKHRRLLHGTRTVLAVNLRHSLKKLAKCVYEFLRLVFESLSSVPRMSRDVQFDLMREYSWELLHCENFASELRVRIKTQEWLVFNSNIFLWLSSTSFSRFVCFTQRTLSFEIVHILAILVIKKYI